MTSARRTEGNDRKRRAKRADRTEREAYAATLPTLPDLLRPGLDLVFVGINPGERSAERGHYYGHPGNAFWRRLSASPLVTREVTADDDAALLDEGIGFTDLVKRVITDSSSISGQEFRDAVPAFLERIEYASPRAICFTAARPFQAVYPGHWRPRAWGRQHVPPLTETLRHTEVWVMPSPSGRAAAYHKDIDAVLESLAHSLRSPSPTRASEGQSGATSPTLTPYPLAGEGWGGGRVPDGQAPEANAGREPSLTPSPLEGEGWGGGVLLDGQKRTTAPEARQPQAPSPLAGEGWGEGAPPPPSHRSRGAA